MAGVLRVSSRNARFQRWESLLGNRTKRQRAGEFLVQGVRPISLAARFGWRFRALIYDAERPLSAWAQNLLRSIDTVRVAMAPGLLAELGEKTEGSPGRAAPPPTRPAHGARRCGPPAARTASRCWPGPPGGHRRRWRGR